MMLLLGFTSALVGGTAAALNATTNNSGFVATASLPGPTGPLNAAASNADVSLTWTNGGLGSGNEYEVYRAPSVAASAAGCPTGSGVGAETSYTSGTAVGSASGTPLTDTGTETLTSTTAGFVCYMLFSAFTSGAIPSAPAWISHPVAAPWNPVANVHLPLVVNSVTFTDHSVACTGGGSSCTLDSTDTIQLTYNQPTNHPAIAGNTDVCVANATGVIYLGSSYTGNTCGASGQLGSIAPPNACGCFSVANAGKDPDYSAAYAWNGAFTVLTITVTASKNTPLTFTNSTSVWTLTPSTTAGVRSNDATALPVCTTSAACTPGTTTRP